MSDDNKDIATIDLKSILLDEVGWDAAEYDTRELYKNVIGLTNQCLDRGDFRTPFDIFDLSFLGDIAIIGSQVLDSIE